jgi:hypothetical protein
MVARQVPRLDAHRDRERRLHRHRAAQHLAPKPHQGGRRKAAAMARDEPAQDLRLAPRTERRHLPVPLGPADRLDELGPAHDEIMQPVVELIDLTAQGIER